MYLNFLITALLIVFAPLMFNQLDLKNKDSPIDKILQCDRIDIKKLRQYAWCGLPNQYRNKVYRILLGITSYKNESYEKEIIEKNRFYFQNILAISEPSSHEKQFISVREVYIDIDQKTLKQIEIDVNRIPKQYLVYKNTSLKFIFTNILKIIAKRRPAIGYVQGMADLIIPLIEIYKNEFFAESTIYFALSEILNSFQCFFIDNQDGIGRAIKKIGKILQVIDPTLYAYFKKINLEIHMFAFRWFNCLFVREFKLEYYLLIFDSMLSTKNFELFLIYFSISLLIKLKSNILKLDFNELMLFLQNIDKLEWKYSDLKDMFANVYVNVNIFEKKFYYDF